MAKAKKSPPHTPITPTPAPQGLDEAPKYTWTQLDAAFPSPSDEERAVYDLAVTEGHQRMGSEIASARILTDAQRWLGQLHDFARREGAPVVLGYSPGLAQVFAARVRNLRGLVARAETGVSTQKLRRSAAEAILDASVLASRARYGEVLAALAGATLTDPTRRAQVGGLSGQPGEAALAGALRSLARLVDDAVAAGSPVRVRAVGRGLSAAVAKELTQLATQVEQSLDGVSGANRREGVSQAEIDREDGAILTLMEELMGLFPTGRRGDVPALRPLATRRYFSSTRRRVAPAPVDPPAPTPVPG
jgi:hypothetical protein